MNKYKKIIAVSTITIVVIFAGIIGYKDRLKKNEQSQNQSLTENIISKSTDKIGSKTCVTAGEAYYPRKEACCDGLTTIFGYESVNGECLCTEKDNNCGGAPICAPCGNKKCEKEFREDKCNCPVDCK